MPRWQAVRQGYKIMQTKWIDVNKGEHENPRYRSRFVGKELQRRWSRESLCSTPSGDRLQICHGLSRFPRPRGTFQPLERTTQPGQRIGRLFFERLGQNSSSPKTQIFGKTQMFSHETQLSVSLLKGKQQISLNKNHCFQFFGKTQVQNLPKLRFKIQETQDSVSPSEMGWDQKPLKKILV